MIKTLLNAGFSGEIFPVNPSYHEVLGLKVFPFIKEIPRKIDLALMIINRRSVPNVMKTCADKGIKAVVDIGPPMAVNNYITIYSDILKTVLLDDNIDCLFNIIWTSPFKDLVEEYLKLYEELKGKYQKTIATWIYGPSTPLINEMSSRMEDLNFPVFSDLETAIKALDIAYQYALRKKGKT